VLAVLVVVLAAPVAALADTVLVRVHGAGTVTEITSANQFKNCFPPTNLANAKTLSESTVVNCRNDGDYGRLWVVALRASVPQAYYDLGWRFSGWQKNLGQRPIQCWENEPATDCKFQVNGASGEETVDVFFTDDVAPAVNLPAASGPATGATVPQKTATFTFTTTDPTAGFECQVDTGTAVACNGGTYTTPTLGEGQHTFRVRAVDPSGNKSAESTRTWTVDSVAPSVAIPPASGPAAGSRTNQTSATFTFDPSEPIQRYECALDNGAYATCTSPHTRSGLADGDRTFRVRGYDAAGNVSSVATRTWTVDTVAPVVSALTGPPASTNNARPQFTFTLNEGSAQCRVDGTDASYVACSSPWTPPAALADGAHTVFVRAADSAGNVSSAVTRAWTQDTVAPSVNLTGTPPAAVKSRVATFTFAADTGVQCRVDNGAFAACSSPFTTAALADGSHTFTVRATDTAGNETARQHVWTVDNVLPTFAFTSGPEGEADVENTGAVFRWAATDQTTLTFHCTLDDVAVGCTSTGTQFADLGDRAHTLRVRVVDAAGNERVGERRWIVDSRAPQITLEDGPAPAAAVNEPPIFRWRADETATFTCRIDTGAPEPCTGTYTVPGIKDGFHTVVITARDAYNHVSELSRSFTLDREAPETTITDGPGEGTTVSNLFTTFLFASDPDVAGYACELDGVAAECTSPFSATLTPGAHTFAVVAVDKAGNVDATPATRRWTIGPQVRALAPADADGDGVTVPTDCHDGDAAIRPGAVDVPGDGVDQDCSGADAALTAVAAALSYQWRYKGSQAWVARFVLKAVAPGSTVTVKCTGPKRACTFKTKTLKGTGKDLDLRKLVFKAKRLRAGAVVTLEIAAPNALAKVTTFKVRKGKAPTGGTFSCRAPGAKKLTKCA
jgi:hypothetical protein